MNPRNCGYCQPCGAGNYDACTTFPVAVQEAKRLIEALPFDEFEITSYPARPTGGMQVGMPSGVTITHKPSKLAVSCDSERSQHRNRDKALQMMALVLAMKGDQP